MAKKNDTKKPTAKNKAVKKPKPIPHEHHFKRSGMTLWCDCGMTQRIDCAHKWELHKREGIQIEKMGGNINQNEETHICGRCGAIANINTTAGTTRITH